VGHRRYGHQAIKQAHIGFLIDAYLALFWPNNSSVITSKAVVDGGILKHEQSY
jgi:hypothetical protein